MYMYSTAYSDSPNNGTTSSSVELSSSPKDMTNMDMDNTYKTCLNEN